MSTRPWYRIVNANGEVHDLYSYWYKGRAKVDEIVWFENKAAGRRVWHPQKGNPFA